MNERLSFKAFVKQKAKGQVTDGTLHLYERDRQVLQGRLGPRSLTVETAQELEAWLRSRTKSPNTLQRWFTSLNWLCRWKGIDYQARRPPKQPNLHPKEVPDKDYLEVLARITDPMERLAVRLSHDTFWSPIDIAEIRREQIDLGDVLVVRKFRHKTEIPMQAVLEKATADELRAYLTANLDLDFIFPGDRRKGMPHRNRTWVNAVFKRYGAAFTPRWFRSSGATRWPGDDIKGLMVQGGWSDPKTIMQHYRANLMDRQVKSFEAAMGRPAKDPDEAEELAGYR